MDGPRKVAYVVYICEPVGSPFIFGGCTALVFIERDGGDGFDPIDSHLSSNYGWAWRDIRRDYHKDRIAEALGGDFEFIDAGVLREDSREKALALLELARGKVAIAYKGGGNDDNEGGSGDVHQGDVRQVQGGGGCQDELDPVP